jgi:hypothetical protein
MLVVMSKVEQCVNIQELGFPSLCDLGGWKRSMDFGGSEGTYIFYSGWKRCGMCDVVDGMVLQ